ncbi:hypothetical protein [Streptomyces sp. NPDC051921]|uniref:hypothetical protein n=1 Tax=Streptomyces sp. NPDC051921 TaxID=3155806 RepID=UPI00342D0662
MMPETNPPRRVCLACDGFATVTITTGLQAADGTRDTVRVHCPTCQGLGHTTAVAFARTGK